MKKRSVLLGTGAFPPILRLWLEMFKKWQDEVDELIIAVDHWNVPEARVYLTDLIKQFPKARLLEGTRGWPESYTDAYEQSHADAFLIIHPDFLIKDFPSMIKKVIKELENVDLIGFNNDLTHVQAHPTFFACKRSSYEKSCKDFSAREGYDHAVYLSGDMHDRGMKVIPLQELGFEENVDFYHIGGVTHVYTWGLGETDIQLNQYLYFLSCLNLPVKLNLMYISRVEKLLDTYIKRQLVSKFILEEMRDMK